MNKEVADRLIAESRENYDSFAAEFAQTRNYLWPEVASLVGSNFRAGDKVLDIGCGNGRFYSIFQERGAEYVGVDSSRSLIAIARKNFPNADFLVADALSLLFEDAEFDMAISLAVLHHIPSEMYRKVFFKEAWRILKPGGRLIVTVWDLRLGSMIKTKKWKRLRSFLKSQIKTIAGWEKLDFGDFYISWQNDYQRYVHSFSLSELKKLATEAGFEILKSGVSALGAKEGNLYIVARKA